ncbi:FHA domain-containing protein [Exilibacterium tricleocarpae]|uniref:FHA domain-containing protein n=1 Tax=Exilibacterium tricleocarpae TaxID=2591008 RepID=A0A545SSM7_9GAMM|nr:FHA domain-containing protein [Exilibacterium tricleocarpae]TQV67980.1 FHA domain-containing protein [Exilibacterium tricleocarpae]
MAILAQLNDNVVVHKFTLTAPGASLGRHPDSDIQIEDNAISANHARITLEPNQYFPQFFEIFLEDVGSTNGTFINDQRVLGKQRLHDKDLVRLGFNSFRFLDDKEEELEKTVHMLHG